MTILLCFTAWTLVCLGAFSAYRSFSKGVSTVKRLHRIPCSQCQYFTENYVLKCTVHPYIALTEEAADCQDYAA